MDVTSSCTDGTCSAFENDLRALKQDLFALVEEKHCNALLIRLAWHDSGTYDASVGIDKWPKCGGANGSIRFAPEINHGANAGLINALNILSSLHAKYESISHADLIQMASAVAVEHAGGPVIAMKYGRLDVNTEEECAPEGNLPAGAHPFPHGADAAGHLRFIFHRMGLTDQDIVALSGAHTLGRAYQDRSGLGKEKTKFTSGSVDAKGTGAPDSNYGREGGSSWTANWLKFDNSYFVNLFNEQSDDELLKLATDLSLVTDPAFEPHAKRYATSQDAFFQDYALAHKKLSELGSKFESDGVTL